MRMEIIMMISCQHHCREKAQHLSIVIAIRVSHAKLGIGGLTIFKSVEINLKYNNYLR